MIDKNDQEKTEPDWLFGSGALPPESPAASGSKEEDGGGDVESQNDGKQNYGSISNKDDNSAAKSSKSGSRSKKSSSQQSRKQKKPPKSVFDDDYEAPFPDDSSQLSDDETGTLLTLDSRPHMPNRNWCVEFFRIFAGVNIVASLGLLTTQLIPIFLAGVKAQGYFDLALKVYVALFCLIFILVECDAPVPFFRKSELLQTYVFRGFLYSFLGLICLEEAYSERVKEMVSVHADEFHVAWASLFMQISSWLIFACGVCYMLMGLCCMKRLRDNIKKKDREVWRKYRKDLKEWKRLNP